MDGWPSSAETLHEMIGSPRTVIGSDERARRPFGVPNSSSGWPRPA